MERKYIITLPPPHRPRSFITLLTATCIPAVPVNLTVREFRTHRLNIFSMNPVHAAAHILTINNRRLFMTFLPKDPVILLSYINTQLRDFYPSLDELCSSLNADKQTLCNTLAQIDYYYDETSNQFV